MKIIEGVFVTGEGVQRSQVEFNPDSGLITRIGERLGLADFSFSEDCLIFAGMGDIHIHAREDVSGKNTYKEDFCSAHLAMKNGGVTHAGDMPNNPVPPVDDESYLQKMKLAQKANGDLWLYAGIGPETKPLTFKVPYKVYMGPSIGELFFKDLPTLDQALSNYRGQVVSFHCEDPVILEAHKTEGTHEQRRPVKAEAVATRDALALIEKYSLKGKLCHFSSREGLELVRDARARGVQVELEVTPQHLYFDVDHLPEEDGILFQMNPPLRHEEDRKEMERALKNGEIQYLATDHAPHTLEEKKKGISGLTGLDTYGGFVTWLIHRGFDLPLIARITAENPGKFFNQFLPEWKTRSMVYRDFGEGLGFLRPGYRANVTVLNTKKPYTVAVKNLRTKVGHSPFLGQEFPGQVEALFIGGQKV